uniref:Uncharacterized protein n=1 Tax=Medicago truncatula TaxID=3880 RepID=I3ST93_MEDTR|nr:unknown [Medicago truncatula]
MLVGLVLWMHFGHPMICYKLHFLLILDKSSIHYL